MFTAILPFLLVRIAVTREEVRSVMNDGGVPYRISNPPGSSPWWKGHPGNYSVNFNHNVRGPVEHFDVYGEVHTKYSQVYWTRNARIDLPPELAARFEGRVMAITGYEVDQVTHAGPQPGLTSRPGGPLGGFSCYPDCGETDRSVPSYHAYNHHYFSWLVGQGAELRERETPLVVPNPTSTEFRTRAGADRGYPTSIVYKENPGGEYRKSYHGYPSGFAQLVHSPTHWVVEPMQIDTHNRDYGINDEEGYRPAFLPQAFANGSQTDLDIDLSPLIECPCTTRITKTVVTSPVIVTAGTCPDTIASEAGCRDAAADFATVISSESVSNASLAPGCNIAPRGHNAVAAVFNRAKSTQACGDGGPKPVALAGQRDDLIGISVALNGSHAHLALSGPAGAWFGVGFGAQAMSDLPYAIVVDGDGRVTERKLASHAPGEQLETSVLVSGAAVAAGVRTVHITRPAAGLSRDHYSFPAVPGEIDVIMAIGSTAELAYHKAHTGTRVVLVPTDSSACVCVPRHTKYISYMNRSRQQFAGYGCASRPRSDMLHNGHGTGEDVPNAACHVESYHGGTICCKHQYFLTDLEQDHLIPDKTDVYFLKWRYYFQEYTPATSVAAASHQHLHHWVFLIDQLINDYEESGGTAVGSITANLTVADMGLEETPTGYRSATFLVMTPHCHAPSCINEELWNADTGELLCNATASYGDERYGSTRKVFNEASYIAINPCIFGFQAGLQTPWTLAPSTRLRAVKRFNNTYRHLGQMAQWTGLAVYNTDPYFVV